MFSNYGLIVMPACRVPEPKQSGRERWFSVMVFWNECAWVCAYHVPCLVSHR